MGSYAICSLLPKMCQLLIVSALYGNNHHQYAMCVQLHMEIFALKNSVLEIFSFSHLTHKKRKISSWLWTQ